jgi:hypothetical protein
LAKLASVNNRNGPDDTISAIARLPLSVALVVAVERLTSANGIPAFSNQSSTPYGLRALRAGHPVFQLSFGVEN